MADLYLARLARVCPPRADAVNGQPGDQLVVACNAATTTVELDNTLFQNAGQRPGSYGRAILRLHAESNDLYVLFGGASTVNANSAATSGNTQCARIPVGQERDYEVDPAVDKWLSVNTKNGAGLTGTCRVQIVSFRTNSRDY